MLIKESNDVLHFIEGIWQSGAGHPIVGYETGKSIPLFRMHCASPEQIQAANKFLQRQFTTDCNLSDAGIQMEGSGKQVESAKTDDMQTILENYADILKQRQADYSEVISRETGKILSESRQEIEAMIAKVSHTINARSERQQEIRKNGNPTAYLRYKALGTVCILGPFNMPGHLPNGQILPALLAGNSIIFKPSEKTPLTAMLLVEALLDAGLPETSIALLHGDGSTAQNIFEYANPDAVFFTGSYAVGSAIHRHFAGRPEILLALEMGGNNPLIAWPSTDQFTNASVKGIQPFGETPGSKDLHDFSDPACKHSTRTSSMFSPNFDSVIEMILESAFATSGQRCTCARRLILPAETGDFILEKLIEATSKLKAGLWFENPAPDIGPLINRGAAEAALQYQSQLEAAGGHICLEMKQLHYDSLVSPGIIDMTGTIRKRERIQKTPSLTENSHQHAENLDSPLAEQTISDTEIFAPLLQVYFAGDFDDAIAIANNTKYGLAAGLISNDPDLYNKFRSEIKAGLINWNTKLTGASSSLPFGGLKRSGNHRPAGFFTGDYCCYPVASLERDLVFEKTSHL